MFDLIRDLLIGLVVGWAAAMLALLAGASVLAMNVVGVAIWAVAFVIAVLARRERDRREASRLDAT